jgi:hypothetical protein
MSEFVNWDGPRETSWWKHTAVWCALSAVAALAVGFSLGRGSAPEPDPAESPLPRASMMVRFPQRPSFTKFPMEVEPLNAEGNPVPAPADSPAAPGGQRAAAAPAGAMPVYE